MTNPNGFFIRTSLNLSGIHFESHDPNGFFIRIYLNLSDIIVYLISILNRSAKTHPRESPMEEIDRCGHALGKEMSYHHVARSQEPRAWPR